MTDAPLPAPLTAADVDLKNFPTMPIDVVRVIKSTLRRKSTPAEFKAAMMLWFESWHQTPAGSLPDDDAELADLACIGTTPAAVRAWMRLRAMALRGWVTCTDRRLYHPVMAAQVEMAWKSKVAQREIADHERDRKRRERDDRAKLFEQIRDAGANPPAWNTTTADLRRILADLSAGQVPDKGGPVRALVTAKIGSDRIGSDRIGTSREYSSVAVAVGYLSARPGGGGRRQGAHLWDSTRGDPDGCARR